MDCSSLHPERGLEVRPVRLGAVEVGGTKVLCLVGSGPEDIVSRARISTGEPAETLETVGAFFRREVSSGGSLAAIGIASSGPLKLRRSHPRYGFITTTPKPGWSNVNVVSPIRHALGVPVGFDTDVNGAALGEEGDKLQTAARLEAAYLAAGLRNIVYALAPQRIVIGGGVAGLPELFPLLRTQLSAAFASYPGLPEHAAEDFVVPATLGSSAGALGAFVLADRARQADLSLKEETNDG